MHVFARLRPLGRNGTQTGAGGNLKTTTYGNGDSVSYTYDELDRPIGKVYTGGRYVTYTYNAGGQPAERPVLLSINEHLLHI